MSPTLVDDDDDDEVEADGSLFPVVRMRLGRTNALALPGVAANARAARAKLATIRRENENFGDAWFLLIVYNMRSVPSIHVVTVVVDDKSVVDSASRVKE